MNNEVAKELAEAFRDLCDFAEGAQYNREGYEIRGEELIARCRAALAKFDAEQGKAAEPVACERCEQFSRFAAGISALLDSLLKGEPK